MAHRQILVFGGGCRERLVSVASAQFLVTLMDEPICWFWRLDGTVQQVAPKDLLAHAEPFLNPFAPRGPVVADSLPEALDDLQRHQAVVIIGLHGGEGEDGTVAGWLEARGIPFTGSGSEASRLAFDKPAARERAAAAGLVVADGELLDSDAPDTLDRLIAMLDRWGEVVVKPAREGSSFGMEVIASHEEAQRFTHKTRQPGYGCYLVERFLDGVELSCGVIDGDVGPLPLPTIEIRAASGRRFDYRGKYLGDGIREICPAEIDPATEAATRNAASVAHQALGCAGYSRSDFIVVAGQPVFLETNTLPGLTPSSLLPRELRQAGMSLADFVARQIELAIRRVESCCPG